jgi:DNA-binding MarR family transcriptional regulator
MINKPGITEATALSSAPSLPTELTGLYLVMSEDNKRLFSKAFTLLWRYVNKRRNTLAVSFWVVDMLRRRSGLPSSDFAVLSYLYFLSGGGVSVVTSDLLYKSKILPGIIDASFANTLNRLKHAGYITRSTSDPGLPFLARSYRRQPVFISLTASGVALIKNIDREIYNIMLHTSLDDITGRNKKE